MKRKAKKLAVVNALLAATSFVELAQTGKGDETSTHCIARYGWLIASNRNLAAGSPIIEQDLDCCPQTELLRLALERCDAEHSIVQHQGSLFVRSGDFSAHVPLCEQHQVPTPIPDPQQAPLGDAFRTALMVAGTLAKENAATVLQSCIQLNPGSCVSTNGSVILEAWHGFDMPPGLLIPKAFCDAVVKARKAIVGFGFNQNIASVKRTFKGPSTFTIHFEDRSWLKTNMYNEKIPDMLKVFVDAPNPFQIPHDFFSKVNEIAKWSDDGRVYLDDFFMRSHPIVHSAKGAVMAFPMPELKQGVSYSIAGLKLISKFATHFEDRVAERMTMFFGHKLRGAIAHESRTADVSKKLASCYRCKCQTVDGICQNYGCESTSYDNSDDDIPF